MGPSYNYSTQIFQLIATAKISGPRLLTAMSVASIQPLILLEALAAMLEVRARPAGFADLEATHHAKSQLYLMNNFFSKFEKFLYKIH